MLSRVPCRPLQTSLTTLHGAECNYNPLNNRYRSSSNVSSKHCPRHFISPGVCWLMHHPDPTTRNTLNIFPVSMWMMGNFIFRLNKHHTQNNRHWCVLWAVLRHPSAGAGDTSVKHGARDKLGFLFSLISAAERAGASLLARSLSANQTWFDF